MHFDSQLAWLTEAKISHSSLLVPRRDSFETYPVQIAIGLRMFVSAGEIPTSSPYYNSFLSLIACVSHCTCIAQWIEMKQTLSNTSVNYPVFDLP